VRFKKIKCSRCPKWKKCAMFFCVSMFQLYF
jgi:hypothetical protein